MAQFHFDPLVLQQFDPQFDWRGRAYFCAGAYACRRNAISYERWLAVESWNRRVPGGLFRFGDMGQLNYLVHAMTQRGEMRTAMCDLQHIWAHHGKEELEIDCHGSGWHFPKAIKRSRVAHFCWRKSFLFDRKSYSRPFTIARLEHQRRHHSDTGAWLAVLNEERKVLGGKIERRLRSIFSAKANS